MSKASRRGGCHRLANNSQSAHSLPALAAATALNREPALLDLVLLFHVIVDGGGDAAEDDNPKQNWKISFRLGASYNNVIFC